MKKIKIGDLSFGIDKQALAILSILSDIEINVKDDYNNKIYIETYPWYNGRENGVCIKVDNFWEDEILLITFGEHRSSDSIFVDVWKVEELANYSSPTLDDLPNKVHRKIFDCWDVRSVVEYIISKIEKFLKEVIV